jgi:FecR protein/Bacterial Ig-like domain
VIHTAGESFETRESLAAVSVQPDTAAVTIPDAHLLFTADFTRKGSDLILTGDDGHKILVPDYFRYDKQPDLVSPEGALLSASLVELLSGSATPGQYAQAAGAPAPQQPIGRVETVSGSASVVRNGVAVDLNVGDLVFQGDVVQTRSDSTLGIGFADGSAFSLQENARMALNEFVYDPNGTSNSALINLVQGTVSFIAAQVAKTGNMRVDTPTATLGIRGTFVTVDVSSVDGHTVASLGLETNPTTGEQFAGAFTLTNRITGNQVTVNQVNSMFSVSPLGLISESAKPLAMQAIEQASFQALSAIAAASAASMGAGPTAPNQYLNDPNSPSGPSNSPAPGGSSGASPAPTNNSPVDNHPTTVTLTTTTPSDTQPNTTTATTVISAPVQTPLGPPPSPTVQTLTAPKVETLTPPPPPTVQTLTAPKVETLTPPPPPPPPTTITITSTDNIVNHATAAAGFTISGTESNADGQTVTVKIVDGSGNVKGTLATTASAGTWSVNVSPAQAQALADGAYTFQATLADQKGNNSNTASQSVTVHETLPTVTISATAGDGDNVVNNAEAHAGITLSGGLSGLAPGSTFTVTVTDGTSSKSYAATVNAAGTGWSATIPATDATALKDGTATVTAQVTDIDGNTSTQATQTFTVAETLPAVTMAQVDGNDDITAANAQAGVTISGTESGADGQTVTVKVLDSHNNVVDTLTTTASGGSWSATLSSAQAQALAHGSYTVQAAVTDQYGNPSNTAAQRVTVTLSVSTPVLNNTSPKEGDTLSILSGGTANDSDAVLSYQWTRDGVNINDATSSTYTAVEADETHKLAVVVTATDPDSSTASTPSAATNAVTDIALSVSTPVLNNTSPKEGDTLSILSGGTANDSDAVLSYQWTRDGVNINGATSPTYTAVETDETHKLAVVVTATDPDSSSSPASTPSAATAAVADVTPTLTVPFSFKVDELTIVKNGRQIYDNPFTQAPPQSPDILKSGVPTPIEFFTSGTWTESNGQAIMSSSGAVPLLVNDGVSAILNTNTQSTSDFGLKQDAAFTVSAKFDLANPAGSTGYGLGLTDGTSTHSSDEVVQIVVQKVNGNVVVDLFQADLTAENPFTLLASQTITSAQLAGNDQIQLQLDHQLDHAGSTAITGSFELLSGGSVTGTTAFSGTGQQGTIFTNGVNWTRAEVLSFAIPTTVTISGLAKEGQTLTANAATNDADATIHYQWERSDDGSFSVGHTTNIGTDSSTYVVQEADEGSKIRVVATTSDADNSGTASATSNATAAVIDKAPSITVSISGTAQEGQTLSAVVSGAEADDTLTYQWFSSKDNYTTAIGSTASYQVQEGDEGYHLKVVATDNGGIATANAITANTVIDATPSITVSISGTAQEGQTLTAVVSGAEADDTLTHQWFSSQDNYHTAIGSGASYLVQGSDEGYHLKVIATDVADNGGGTATANAITSGTVIDETPSITVSISGTAEEGHTLHTVVSGFEDDDTLSYQWQSSSDGGHTWSNIADATGACYQVQEGDEGHQLQIVVTDTTEDDSGTATASAATYVGTQVHDWNTAVSGSWGTAANWSNGVPTSSIDALINATGVSLVSAAVANSLLINSNATVAAGSDDSLTITGALTVDAGSISLTGGTIQAGSIDLESATTLVGFGTVSGPITNSGLIEAQSSHTLDISGNISGTGSIEVLNHATLEVDGSVASTQTLSFAGGNGATGTLVLDHSLTQAFSAVISGLGQNDDIDLKDLTFTTRGDMTASTSYANGHTTLVVSNTSKEQSVTLKLAGDYTHSTWNFAQDSGTGTIFHDPPATDTNAPAVASATSTDLAQTVTAALTAQNETADQFTFQSDSHGSTLADSTLVASADPSATDAATLDPTSSSSSDHQPTAPATTDGSAVNGLASNVATPSQPPTSDSTSTGPPTGATTQTAVASPAAIGPNGRDAFVFAANFGHETITNFHPDTDVIEIDHAVFADLHALLAATHDDGNGNAVITANPHDTITVKNVTVAQLVQHQGDFHFT